MEKHLLESPLYVSFRSKLTFINIFSELCDFFEWKPANVFSSAILDQTTMKQNLIENEFFQIHKGANKVLYTRNDGIYYSIGAKSELNNQLLEALLEYIIKIFNKKYNLEEFKSYAMIHHSVFEDFRAKLNIVLDNFVELELVKEVSVPCKVCKKNFQLIVKASDIEKSDRWPVPIVTVHEGHALLCYIDRDFKCRASGKVKFAG